MSTIKAVWQSYIVNPSTQQVVNGAEIRVFEADGGAPATLYADRDGNSTIANPTFTLSDGFIRFYVDAGRYHIEAHNASGEFSRFENVLIGELDEGAVDGDNISDNVIVRRHTSAQIVTKVGAVAGLKLLTDRQSGESVFVEGRSALFVWDATDRTAEVTADPEEVEWIAPDDDATGATGAWFLSSLNGVKAVTQVPTITELRALTGLVDGQVVEIATTGRAGSFVVIGDAGDFPAELASDPEEGVYVEAADGKVLKRDVQSFSKIGWFGGVPNASTDATGAIEGAVNSLLVDPTVAANIGLSGVSHSGGVELDGAYIVGDAAWKSSVMLRGWAGFSYSFQRKSSCTLIREPSANYVIDASGTNDAHFENVHIDGNGGDSASGAGDIGSGFDLNNGATFKFRDGKIFYCNNGIDGKYSSVFVSDSEIRNNRIGIRNAKDAQIRDCTFSGNSVAGYLSDGGNVQIIGCNFEFQRSNGTEASNAIRLTSGSGRHLVSACRFDRNTGNDIRATGTVSESINQLDIIGNQFKRSAWGTDLADSERAAIYCSKVRGLNILNNSMYHQNFGESATEGLNSPLYGAIIEDCTGVVIKGNDFNGVKSRLDLVSSGDFQWTPSGSGTGEFYLEEQGGGNPWAGTPDNIEESGAFMSAGVAGALSASEWDWADNDALGFSTVYVRLSDDADPDSKPSNFLIAYYQGEGYKLINCVDVETDSSRDIIDVSIPSGSTQNIVLRTRDVVPSLSARHYMMRVSMRENVSTQTGMHTLSLAIKKAGASVYPTIAEKTYTSEDNVVTFGPVSSGADIEVASVSVSGNGDQIRVALENTAPNRIDCRVDLER